MATPVGEVHTFVLVGQGDRGEQLVLSECGKCGAAIIPGQESKHATWHGTAGWSQQAAMTVVREPLS
jgi:hypothetical protein